LNGDRKLDLATTNLNSVDSGRPTVSVLLKCQVDALERSLGERPAASTVMRFYDAYLYNRRPMIRATPTGDRRMAVRISGLGPARTRLGGSSATTE
jgi:hypothetical protein